MIRGPEGPEVAINLSNLGGVLERQGEYEDAEAHYQLAILLVLTGSSESGAKHYNAAVKIAPQRYGNGANRRKMEAAVKFAKKPQ